MAIDFSSDIISTIAEAGQTCDIKKPVQTVGRLGQTIRDFIDHKTGVACWRQEKSSSSLTADGKVFLDNRVFFYFGADPEIFEGYVIFFNSQEYIIEGINDQGGIGQLFRADVGFKK